MFATHILLSFSCVVCLSNVNRPIDMLLAYFTNISEGENKQIWDKTKNDYILRILFFIFFLFYLFYFAHK